MKKFLLIFVLLFSFVFWINNVGAEWTIDWNPVYIWTWEDWFITYCSNSPIAVWWIPYWYLTNTPLPTDSSWMDTLCGPNTTTSTAGNPITQLANDTGNGGITEAGNIMNSPIGYMAIFGLALILISVVVLAVKIWFFSWDNKKVNGINSRLSKNVKKSKKFKHKKNQVFMSKAESKAKWNSWYFAENKKWKLTFKKF